MRGYFFYFSQNVCPPCLSATVDLVKKYFPDYKHLSTVVFISPDWPPLLRNDCYGTEVLTLQNGTLGIELEEEGFPFFFKLSPDMELTSVHIVTKVDFVRTEAYLKNISGAY